MVFVWRPTVEDFVHAWLKLVGPHSRRWTDKLIVANVSMLKSMRELIVKRPVPFGWHSAPAWLDSLWTGGGPRNRIRIQTCADLTSAEKNSRNSSDRRKRKRHISWISDKYQFIWADSFNFFIFLQLFDECFDVKTCQSFCKNLQDETRPSCRPPSKSSADLSTLWPWEFHRRDPVQRNPEVEPAGSTSPAVTDPPVPYFQTSPPPPLLPKTNGAPDRLSPFLSLQARGDLPPRCTALINTPSTCHHVGFCSDTDQISKIYPHHTTLVKFFLIFPSE